MSINIVREKITTNEYHRESLRSTELHLLSEAAPSFHKRNIAIAIALIVAIGAGIALGCHGSPALILSIAIPLTIITACLAYFCHKNAKKAEEHQEAEQEKLLGDSFKVTRTIRTLEHISQHKSSELVECLKSALPEAMDDEELIQYTPTVSFTVEEWGKLPKHLKDGEAEGFRTDELFEMIESLPGRKEEIETCLKGHFGEEGFALIQQYRQNKREMQLAYLPTEFL